MRLVAAVLVLSGCDLVFGTTSVTPKDAGDDVDAPDDGPQGTDGAIESCGMGVPMFGGNSTSFTTETGCIGASMTIDGTKAVATCVQAVKEGTLDGSLAPAAFDDNIPLRELARIAPDGDELYVNEDVDGTGGNAIVVYERQGGAWKRTSPVERVVNFPAVFQPLDFSMPTKRLIGVAAMIVQIGGSGMPFEEYVRKPNGTWSPRQNPHTATELGVGRMRQPNLSADGKTLVFVGTPATGGVETLMFAHRGDMGLDFGAAEPIMVPFAGPQYPYLRPDCSRLYLNSDSGLIYTQPPS